MTPTANYHLFVYGSLRSSFQSAAYEYISRYFTIVGDAKVKGVLYDMGDYPAAVAGTGEAFIAGELYLIKNENEFPWAIAQLDDYEGVFVEAHERPLYRREIVDVYTGEGTTPAWIYWYNGDTGNRTPIASGDIVDYLKNKS